MYGATPFVPITKIKLDFGQLKSEEKRIFHKKFQKTFFTKQWRKIV